MKVTKNYIKQLVKEELEKSLREGTDNVMLGIIDDIYKRYTQYGSGSQEFKDYINIDNLDRLQVGGGGLQSILDFLIKNVDKYDVQKRLYPFFKFTDALPLLVSVRNNKTSDNRVTEEDMEPSLQSLGESSMEEIPQAITTAVQDTFNRAPASMKMYRKFIDHLDRLQSR
tara:strand:- start:427 stop:936 length:510 start_codon:yes stop_codon:yes gene_type:complete